MTVKVLDRETGQSVQGKLAVIRGDQVALYSGTMSDKKGGIRGCGKRWLFPLEKVTLSADNPDQEIKRS